MHLIFSPSLSKSKCLLLFISLSNIANILYDRCKSRTKDSYSVAEYRGILESTLQDFITVLHKPEWPAAELLLQAFSELMVSWHVPLDGQDTDLYNRLSG